MNNYYKEAIYDMFEVNPYSYDSVKNQEERNIQNEKPFFDSKQLLDLGDQLKDVGIDTAKILEDLYLTSEIDWLDFKWNGAYKLGFTEEASKISKELNMKTVKLYEDTVDGGNIDKAGYVVSALIYGAKIYSDYNKINNYDNDTAYCLAAEVDSMKYAYSDTSSIGWLQIADRVSKDVLDSRNNARDSILDNTIDLMQGEGNDLIVSAASGEALLVMKAATFLTNIICKDIIEAEHHEIITMLQQDMQYQSYNLCYELWKKAESENFSNAETVIRFVDALKFFYRFSMAYYNSIQQWGEHYYPNEDWKTPFQNRNDAMALKFYNLLNAKMMPNENLYNYEAWKDDEFSESAFQESTSEIIDISSYTGRYGKDNIYVEIAPVGDSEVNISVEFLTDSKSILSTISYNGTINKYMSFEACDRSSNNAYTIDLLEESIHLTVHRLKYINDMNPWDMPDTDIILPRLSDKTSNRDISDWTNDMIANAINHYLQYYYDDYYVDSSDIVEDLYSKYVYLKAKNGEATPPQTKYIARWNQQNDIWQFGIANSDVGVIFHLTDFDPNYTSPIKGTSTFNSTHEEIYYSYIENELIPKYGLCPSGEDIAYEDLVGKIVSAYIFEDKETKQHNLLTVRYPETLYESCILSLYSKNNDEIVLLDEYIINIFPTEFELGFNNGYVCYRAQAYSNSGISYDFDYYIFDVNNNHIKLLHHYRINGFFVEPYEISIYDEENKSINRQQIEQTIAEYGINYTINEDYYSINFENENGILDIHLFVPLCGLNDPSFSYKIKDYTNLVNHIHTTNKVGKVITEKDPLNVRQSPSTESEKIGTVDKGSTITILSEVNGWYEIEFNGKSGYVSGEFVQIVE
ncbi:SH3 domain-containing protein, partial [Holdemanella sp.]|uniref:SH3 domain-containing protein n=1 Tax=Holdemanella sp. TaxID=1971762 RepID=UPI003AEF52F4